MKDVITKAVEEERENLEKVHAEEREMWKTEHARDQERVAEAIQAAVQEQQRMSQVSKSRKPGASQPRPPSQGSVHITVFLL